MTDSPIIELAHVYKQYSTKRGVVAALDDVSLAVHPSEVVGVIGESGSGKSTLARLLVGLEQPDTGTVKLLDRPIIGRRSREERRAVQVVFQDPQSSLNPRLAILASVADFARVHRLGSRAQCRTLAREALSQFHVPDSAGARRPSELSGGQLQRVCIARALVPSPQLLVADEPTSSLDVSIQGQILNLLDELRLKMSIVLISHDIRVTRFLATRLCVMLDGKIIEEGATETVISEPQHPYTRKLVEAGD